MPAITRRQLLAAMALSPLLWQQGVRAETIDNRRIVALEWLPIELMMALGVVPMAAAELFNYRDWVGKPQLPASVIDVGLRTEPNMELLTQLRPSLILYSSGYGPSPARLARIAPCLGFAFNSGEGKPLTSARHSLMQLAQRIGKVPQAQAHLQQFASFISEMRARLAPWAAKPLLLMSLIDSRHVIVFGKGSLFLETLQELGLQSAWQGETNFWGSAVVGIERLASVRDAEAICFDHGDAALMAQVGATELWQSLPFVRQQRFRRVPTIWFYGATLSAMEFCRTLAHELEA
ncbi:Fe(3+)-hydroxamate ABC transporter substrate-binding protein FhuD [Mixta tenebrionis]|uniref:Fe(3+)-hydroxamate ABC transporter substrate-binding protein FhuD n=1 Tax=Mixta tenebrionis TaxID=2562439 RepID=A0A506VDU8_9GAMM|nr:MULTISPECIES: Fe(3+)-hydroxamate ABC transporter substrate-binding protein FhuD [Mixta]QHM76621.1 Iron(3+)-hydroxamate-binding protein FhuD [Mixta theicola]TPW43957.1 Fe(3+)-hydroxamate ABC transporter substrate-binding protein FhuD [Mixta tenebrionis]